MMQLRSISMRMKISNFWLFFCFSVGIFTAKSMHEDIKTEWKQINEQKVQEQRKLEKAQKDLEDARKKEDQWKRNQETVLAKADRLEKEIKEEEKKGTFANQKIIKDKTMQRQSSLETAEMWAGRISEEEKARYAAERSVKTFEQELQKIEKEAARVGALLQQESTQPQDWQKYNKTTGDKIAKATSADEKSLILRQALRDLKTNYPSYDAQQKGLEQLLILAKEQNNTSLMEELQKRIKEITTFLGQRHAPINAADRELKLYDKIPSDQIATLNDKFNEWAQYIGAESIDEQSRAKMLTTLKETQAAIMHHNLNALDPKL